MSRASHASGDDHRDVPIEVDPAAEAARRARPLAAARRLPRVRAARPAAAPGGGIRRRRGRPRAGGRDDAQGARARGDARRHGLDFGALQLRLHPAASRVAKLAQETPASFVAFDLIAIEGRDLRATPQRERRALLERVLAHVGPPIYITPMTRDTDLAREWLARFEGAGLDGVVVKPEDGTYEPGQARDDQGQARPHGGLCRGGFSLAQKRKPGTCGFAVAWVVR